MTAEKAIYSYKKVNECITEIKKFSITVSKRVDHFSKSFELEKLYNMCLEKTGCLLLCAEHGTNLAGASPATGFYRQV